MTGQGRSQRSLPGFTPGGSLLERAAGALSDGPLHTLELAGRVLRLSGNPAAASAAVFALLGRDPRFEVDGDGNWRMADGATPPGRPLMMLDFAVVDIETTGGGFSRGHRVTEVAVVPVSGGRVGEVYRTLVHPGRRIPPRIQALTGITNEMVAGAPSFDVIADDLRTQLEGRIFVAHNVAFDWGFIREELLTARGDVPAVERLCTVRMGRRLVPGLRSYALDSLTRHFRIEIQDRHRAFGDAIATSRLLLLLLERAELEGLADLEGLRRHLAGPGSRRRRRRDVPP